MCTPFDGAHAATLTDPVHPGRRRDAQQNKRCRVQDPKYAHFLREALAADKGCKISDRCVCSTAILGWVRSDVSGADTLAKSESQAADKAIATVAPRMHDGGVFVGTPPLAEDAVLRRTVTKVGTHSRRGGGCGESWAARTGRPCILVITPSHWLAASCLPLMGQCGSVMMTSSCFCSAPFVWQGVRRRR